MRRRFPGLDFLRFYAALSVVIGHTIADPNAWFGHPLVLPALQHLVMEGGDAVTCFFTLSGFLITYLLLTEKRKTGTVHVKAFYKRRILRIWPLYFLVLILGFLVVPLLFPHAPEQPSTSPLDLSLFVFFLANVAFALGSGGFIAQLWSVSIEEQFYLVWPILIRKAKYIPLVLVGVIVVRWLVLGLVIATHNDTLYFWIIGARFDCMAVGGIGAYLVFQQQRLILRVLYHPAIQLCAMGLIVLFLIYSPNGPQYDLMKACVFMVYIVNVATNPRAIGRVETRWTESLGNISYGMYMLHTTVIYALAWILPVTAEWPLMIGTVTLTILAASISYRWFETPFLRLKQSPTSLSLEPLPHKSLL